MSQLRPPLEVLAASPARLGRGLRPAAAGRSARHMPDDAWELEDGRG
ncbi:MAG: hypothetical protein MUF35_07105 [Candidatus Nanopelagicales bacterium]|nr:hypothetical protein [Candidatus Nanopelagicales bacterium]